MLKFEASIRPPITVSSSSDTEKTANSESSPGCSNHQQPLAFLNILASEREALSTVEGRLQGQREHISAACKLLVSCRENRGRVVVSGLGKAGLIGRKIAATLSSTGTAATFMHPVEGLHGDVGFVDGSDIGLLLSYSGETAELLRFGQALSRLGCPLLAITRRRTNGLGQLATVCIELGDISEACHLGLAPSSSTTAMLAVGDALALSVAQANGFCARDFARFHPAGSLGLSLRPVTEVMRTGSRLVCVAPETPVQEVVQRVTTAKTGAALLTGKNGDLVGIFTDGDLRRAIIRGSEMLDVPIIEVATSPCHSISANTSLAEALQLLRQMRIEDLPVVDCAASLVQGLLCLKDIPVV